MGTEETQIKLKPACIKVVIFYKRIVKICFELI
jgi:hypothetical protein